jgi:hypothetical protein
MSKFDEFINSLPKKTAETEYASCFRLHSLRRCQFQRRALCRAAGSFALEAF